MYPKSVWAECIQHIPALVFAIMGETSEVAVKHNCKKLILAD